MKISSFFNIKPKAPNVDGTTSEGFQKGKSPESMASGSASGRPSAREVVQSAGLGDKPLLESAVRIFQRKQIDPTPTTLKATQAFLDKSGGTDASKLKTIEIASVKGMDITEDNLTAVHTALNDPAVDAESLNTLMPEVGEATSSLDGKGVDGTKGREGIVEKGAYTDLKEALIKSGMEASKAEAVVAQLKETLAATGNPVEALKTLMNQLPKDSPMKEIIQKGIEQLSSGGKGMTGEWQLKDLVKVLMASEKLLEVERMLSKNESAALEKLMARMMNGLNSLGEGAHETVDASLEVMGQRTKPENLKPNSQQEGLVDQGDAFGRPALEDGDSFDLPMIGDSYNNTDGLDPLESFLDQVDQMVEDTWLQTLSAYGSVDPTTYFSSENTKTYLVKAVTAGMIEAKQTFNQFKESALKQIEPLLQNPNAPVSSKQLSQAVTSIAERLDHVIMNTDLTLYTDMKTEKKLIGLSSQLQQIAQLAHKEPHKALGQLRDIQKKIDALTFTPSRDRVEVHATKRLEDLMKTGDVEGHRLMDSLGKTSAGHGAKPLMDLMKALGLNHEPELLEQVMSSRKDEALFSQEKDNLKQMLLKLQRDAESDPKTVKGIDKALLNLTGQQLLNKQDVDKNTQTMFFNVPINQNQEAKIYIKAREKKNGLDWENCTAVVLVDTKAYGVVGVRLNITDRHLNMSVMTTSKVLEQDLKPYADQLVTDLRDIGYYPNPVKFLIDEPSGSGEKVLSGQEPTSETKATTADKPAEAGGFEVRI